MVKPASSFSRVRVASVLMLSGVMPAFPSCAESAMEKHPACAAAISSSGLVPCPSSKRVLNEYGVAFSTPLAVVTMPLPSLSPPFQTAPAFLSISPLLEGLQNTPTYHLAAPFVSLNLLGQTENQKLRTAFNSSRFSSEAANPAAV